MLKLLHHLTKKGNRENPNIFKFHESVLNENGGSWLNPPKDIIWSDTLLSNLNKIIQPYEEYDLWGFKDPRSIFTIEKWIEVFSDEINFKLVGSYRHPISVAISLHKRNDAFTIDEGIDLWFKYNSKLLELCAKYPIKLIHFDANKEDYLKSLDGILESLGLDSISSEELFYSRELISSEIVQEKRLSENVLDVYKRLSSYQ